MEVAQIARGIVLQLKKSRMAESIRPILPTTAHIETISFAHDIGHPPFGHGGEIALNYVMRNHGGFEGNGQSLRLCASLESHTEGHGLDLMRRTLLGILKYPAPHENVRAKELPAEPEGGKVPSIEWKPPKCYLATESNIVDWILEPLNPSDREEFSKVDPAPAPKRAARTRYKALDTSIMELADDISYGVHDLEDGAVLGLIGGHHWDQAISKLEATWLRQFDLDVVKLKDDLFSGQGQRDGRRKRAIGGLVNAFIGSLEIAKHPFESQLLANNIKLTAAAAPWLEACKTLTMDHIIETREAQTLEYRGRHIIVRLLEAIRSSPEQMLPASFKSDIADRRSTPERAICDYIAGMTDAYAEKIYRRLFVPGDGSVFERI